MRALVTPLVVLAVLSGCGGDSTPQAPAAAPAASASRAAEKVPAPAGRVVLTIHGAGRPNVGSEVRIDQATLDAMATVDTDINEPFLKKRMNFDGISMAELFSRVGITGGTVQMHALDDYKVDIPVADVTAPGVLLATRQNDAPIPVADGGPIRLVFPDGSKTGQNTDLWIWSLVSITVR